MQDNTLDRQSCLQQSIVELQAVNKKLSKLTVQKEQLTSQIVGALGHEHEGQRTYEYEAWKIEIKTPCIYSLNKKLYEDAEFCIPKKFNPIKKSISYTVDKRLCEKSMIDAPPEIREILIDLIEKRPGKANVTIKDRAS